MFKRVLFGFVDFYFDYEEVDGDDVLNAEYPCPFCPDEFDLVELCYHIDEEHPVEAKYGVSKSLICYFFHYGFRKKSF